VAKRSSRSPLPSLDWSHGEHPQLLSSPSASVSQRPTSRLPSTSRLCPPSSRPLTWSTRSHRARWASRSLRPPVVTRKDCQVLQGARHPGHPQVHDRSARPLVRENCLRYRIDAAYHATRSCLMEGTIMLFEYTSGPWEGESLKLGSRSMRVESAIRTSRRASGAPRHTRVKAPKEACFRAFERWMSKWSGFWNIASSRLAEPTCR
jgi:hypothetical protein